MIKARMVGMRNCSFINREIGSSSRDKELLSCLPSSKQSKMRFGESPAGNRPGAFEFSPGPYCPEEETRRAKSRISAIEKNNKELSKKLAAVGRGERVEAGSEPEAGHVRGVWQGDQEPPSAARSLPDQPGHAGRYEQDQHRHWEKKSGKITIRKPEVKEMLMALKGMKKAEVAARLGTPKRPGKDSP